MKKIVHLMKVTNFSEGVSSFYRENFPNHIIYYVCSEIAHNPNVTQNNSSKTIWIKKRRIKRLIQFLKIIKAYDYVVIHSLSILDSFGLLTYLLPKKYYKKMVWIEWGGDLYESENKCLKFLINERVKTLFKIIVFIFPPDLIFYKNKYQKTKSMLYYAPYSVNKIDHFYDGGYVANNINKNKTKGTIRIMIGHNGKKALNHIKVLRDLLKFNNQNIELFIPLCYGGDAEYIKDVKAFASSHYKNVIFLDSMLSKKEYNEEIKKVDIAIFNTERQIGLANLHMLLFQKSKIYMTSNCPMFSYFNDAGFNLVEYEFILNSTFEDFINREGQKVNNKQIKYFDNYLNRNKKIELWNQVYKQLE